MFVYHRFDDSRHPSTNTTEADLRADFEYFKQNGYEVIPLLKLVQSLKEKKPISNKWVVLTIDDNFKTFYTNGLEIFKEYGYPFSLFVYVEATQKKYPDYMSWDELKESSKYGSLEFHSYAHGHMTHMSNEDIKNDIDKGLALFKKNLNMSPKFFTYPYGEFSPRVKKIVMSYGFEAIINQNMGAVSSFSDTFDMDRTALVGKNNLPLYLRHKALNATWIKPTLFPEDNHLKELHVRTNESAKSGQVYITGYPWMRTKLNNGNFDLKLNKQLKKKRSRIVVSIGNKISTKLLIKDSHGTK